MKRFFKVTGMIAGTIFTLALFAVEVAAVGAFAYVDSYSKERGVGAELATRRIVIDAGHGGRDAGVSGSGGTKESEVALKISNFLYEELQRQGMEVHMTREGEAGLYDNDVPNRKKDDMVKRHKIIQAVKPDLVVSIHLNSYPRDRAVHGIQCFYHVEGESGKPFAEAIQKHLNDTDLFGRDKNAAKGDYFILETEYPSVLIECGFLSNPEEEQKLATEGYQRLLASEIARAIVASFS